MPFSSHIVEFLKFVLIGGIIGIIFDFFRAYRKNKKVSTFVVTLQDIIYFLIIFIVLILGILLLLDSEIRLYIFAAIFLGIFIYFFIFSKLFIKLFLYLIKISRKIFDFFIMPFTLIVILFKKIYHILKTP